MKHAHLISIIPLFLSLFGFGLATYAENENLEQEKSIHPAEIFRERAAIREQQEKKLGTAREVAKRCSDFELKTESMTTMYCLPLFRRAISIAVATTGCQAGRYDTLFLIREELRSIWFFDTRTFLVVVEDVLKDNFNCSPKE